MCEFPEIAKALDEALEDAELSTEHCHHFTRRLLKRALTMLHVLYVLRNGDLEEYREWSEEHQSYKYRVSGFTKDSGSRRIKVVFVPYFGETMLRLVTVYWEDEFQTRAGTVAEVEDD